MATYTVTIDWKRSEGEDFVDNRYSRAHVWHFDGNISVPASSSKHVVPLPLSVEAAVDPEEAFVASLSSCHMLWFLSIAAKAGFRIDAYEDMAEGIMARNAEGKLAMIEVTLQPEVRFSPETPIDKARHEALHHEAHEACFIANSVLTQIRLRPRLA